MATRTSICSSPDCQWWASSQILQIKSNQVIYFSLFGRCVAPLLILFCLFSPLCRITMESHFPAPQQLSLAETVASPITPTQVKLLFTLLARSKIHLSKNPGSDLIWLTCPVLQVKLQSLAGMTPPPQHPPQAWQPRSLPRARAKDRARASLSHLRPSLSPRASRSTTTVSRLFCLQATATQACLTTLGCPVPCPALPPSSMAPPCLFLRGGRDQPQPSNTV